MIRWFLLAFFCASTMLAHAPRLEVSRTADSTEHWVVSRLPPILDDDEMRRQLDTGLTTSLVFRLTWRDRQGKKIEGGARAQIRYELWDELYEVAVLDGQGRLQRAQLATFDALAAWWSELRLVVLVASPAAELQDPRFRPSARLSVDVVPFSRAEQQDTQRWFSESLEKAGRGNTEEVARSVEEPEKLSRVLGLLMATSIQRRAILTHRWSLEPKLLKAAP